MMAPPSQPYRTPTPSPRPPSQVQQNNNAPISRSPFYPTAPCFAQPPSSGSHLPPTSSPFALPNLLARPTSFTPTARQGGAQDNTKRFKPTEAASSPTSILSRAGELIGAIPDSSNNDDGAMMPPSSQLSHLSYSSPPNSQDQQPSRCPSFSGRGTPRTTAGVVNTVMAGGRAAELMLAEMEDRRPWGDKLMDAHAETVKMISTLQDTCSSLSADEKTIRDQLYGLLSSVKALPTKDDIMEDMNAQIPLFLETALQPILDKFDSYFSASTPSPQVTPGILSGHLDQLRKQINADFDSSTARLRPAGQEKHPVEEPMMRLINHLIACLEPVKALEGTLPFIRDFKDVLPILKLLPEVLIDVTAFKQVIHDLSNKMTTGMDKVLNGQHREPARSATSKTPFPTPEPEDTGMTRPQVSEAIIQQRPNMRFSTFSDSPEIGATIDMNPCPASPTLHPSLRSPVDLPPQLVHTLPSFVPLPPSRRPLPDPVLRPEPVTINPSKFSKLCDDVSDLRGVVNALKTQLENPPAPSWMVGLELKIDQLVQSVEEVRKRPTSIFQQDTGTPIAMTHPATIRTPVSNPPRPLSGSVLSIIPPSTLLHNAGNSETHAFSSQDRTSEPELQLDRPHTQASEDVFGPIQPVESAHLATRSSQYQSDVGTYTSIADRAKNLKRPALKRKLTEESASSDTRKRKSTSSIQKTLYGPGTFVLGKDGPTSRSDANRGMTTRSRSRSSGSQASDSSVAKTAQAAILTTQTALTSEAKQPPKRKSKRGGTVSTNAVYTNNGSHGSGQPHASSAKQGPQPQSKKGKSRGKAVEDLGLVQQNMSQEPLSQTQTSHDTQDDSPSLPLPDGGRSKEEVTGITTSESSSDDSRASDFEATERKKRAAAAKKKSLGRNRSKGSTGHVGVGRRLSEKSVNGGSGDQFGGTKEAPQEPVGTAGERLREIQRSMLIATPSSPIGMASRVIPVAEQFFASPFLPSAGATASTLTKSADAVACEFAEIGATQNHSRTTFSALVGQREVIDQSQITQLHRPSPLRALSSFNFNAFLSDRELNSTQSRTLETQNSAGAQSQHQQSTDTRPQSQRAGEFIQAIWMNPPEPQSVGFPISNVRGGHTGSRAITDGGRRIDERRLIPVTSDSDGSITISELEA